MDKYIKYYAKYGMKRSNKSFYKDKEDYLKLTVEELEKALGCYDAETRTVTLDRSAFSSASLQEINATILHEFAHALLEDIFKDSDFLVTTQGRFHGNIDRGFPKGFEIEQLAADYLAYLYMGNINNSKLMALYRLSVDFYDNPNPMDVLDKIYPFRDKMRFDVGGLKRVDLDNPFLTLWLSNLTGKSEEEIKALVGE